MRIDEVYGTLISKLGGRVGSVSTPLTLPNIESIYASPDPAKSSSDYFLKMYRNFEQEFAEAVMQSNMGRNTAYSTIEEINQDILSKGLDFSLITDSKTRRKLQEKFKRKIINLPALINNGPPTVSVPSSNPYTGSMRYLVDATNQGGEFVHPVQVLLSRLNLTINPNSRPENFEFIGFGGKVMSSAQIESALAGGGGVIRPASGGIKKVLTLDIETTGVDARSVARTLAVSESYMNSAGEMVNAAGQLTNPDGTPVRPNVLSNVFLDVDALHGQTVTTQSGATQKVSDFLIQREIGQGPGSVIARSNPEMLDALEGLLTELNTADTVVTYNARFDISKLLETIDSIDGSKQHQGLMSQLEIFRGKLNQEGFISDQLLSVSNYLQQQAIEIMRNENPEIFDDSFEASRRFQRILYGRSAGMPAETGQGLKYAGVTQVADNTNLLDLIRRDAPEVFNEIHSGSHIASMDVIIEDYIRRYMDSGELSLDEIERRNILSSAVQVQHSYLNNAEINRARNVIRRSSAINATTDIANVQQMSDLVFRSIYEKDTMLQRVAIESTIEEPIESITDSRGRSVYRNQRTRAFTRQRQSVTGVFAFDKETGKFQLYEAKDVERFSTTVAPRVIDSDELEYRYGLTQDNIKDLIRQNLADARAGDQSAAESVVRTGINYGTASKMDRIQNLDLINIGRRAATVTKDALNDDEILSALGGVYETFGTSKASLPGFGHIVRPRFFKSGLGRYTDEAAEQVANNFANIGYGYVGDPEERVVSTILAKHTSGLGRAVERTAIDPPSSQVAPRDLRFASRSQDLIEMGLTYFKSGTKYNVRNMLEESYGLSNKLIIPLQIVEEAVRKAVDAGDVAPEKVMLDGRVSLDDVGFSFGDIRRSAEPDDIGRGVNVVWNTARSLNQDESRAVAEHLLNIFNDVDEVRSLLNLSVDEELGPALKGTIAAVEAKIGPGQTAQAAQDAMQEAINSVTEKMNDGIVIGNLDIDEPQTLELEQDFKRIGIDTSSDVISGSRTSRILTSGIDTDQGSVGVLAPVRDTEVLERMGDEAKQLVKDTDSNYLRVVGDLAERIDESPELGRAVNKKISTSVSGGNLYKAEEFYTKYKKKGLMGLGIAAATAVGYYSYGKRQERSVYDETLEEQPYEDKMNKYSLGESYSLSGPSRLDPMSTTSVVNDLNSRRINHTNMSNGKNDHLFNGAF